MKRISLAVLALCFMPTFAWAQGFEILAPHRAIYDIVMKSAEDRSGIDGIDGRIAYEVTGNQCEGIAVSYRFVTRIKSGGNSFVTDQQTANHESADGREFSFSTRSFVNEQADQNIVGSAVREDDEIKINFTDSDSAAVSVEPGIFTTSHLVEVITAAQAGESFVTHQVFDGSGTADKVLRTASVIGKPRIIDEQLKDEGDGVSKQFKAQTAWPVTMSYFDNSADNTAESIPIYEVSFLMYENGIARDLTMRYPDYTLKASLSQLEIYEPTQCKIKTCLASCN